MRTTLLLVLCVTAAPGQDWTRFRGPDGSGISRAQSVPSTFDMKDVNWRVELPGRGHSSPVIWKEKIFLTSEGSGGKRWILCLHTADGRILWKSERGFTPHDQHRFNSFASSTPVIDEKHLYLLWTSGRSLFLAATDHDGKPVWRRRLGPFSAQHGSGISPVRVGKVVIAGNDNEGEESFLTGIDRLSGRTLWKRNRKSSRASYATPIVHRSTPDRVEVIFASTSHGITSLDPGTGALNWETGPVYDERCVGSPAIADGFLFSAAGSGSSGKDCVVLRLPKGASKKKPEVLYRMRRAIPYVPTPIGVGKWFFLFSDGGIVSCIKAASGELVWRQRLEASFYGSPVCIAGRIYALSRSGELFVVDASAEFKLHGRVDLGERTSATPAVAGGVLYLRTERHLISVGGKAN